MYRGWNVRGAHWCRLAPSVWAAAVLVALVVMSGGPAGADGRLGRARVTREAKVFVDTTT